MKKTLVVVAVVVVFIIGSFGASGEERERRGLWDWFQRWLHGGSGAVEAIGMWLPLRQASLSVTASDDDVIVPGTVFDGKFVDPLSAWQPGLDDPSSSVFKAASSNYSEYVSSSVVVADNQVIQASIGYHVKIPTFARSQQYGGIEADYSITITQIMRGGVAKPSKRKFVEVLTNDFKTRWHWIPL